MDSSTSAPKTSRNTMLRCGCIASIILGVLALAAVYVVRSSSGMLSRPNAALRNAQDITKALRHYAQDHDGKFPEGTTNSNQAFRQLFPDYLEDEKLFFVINCAWHDSARMKRPDGDIGDMSQNYAQAIERGENHWAYVSGLSLSSPPKTPLIADGFVEGQIGAYTDVTTKKGGVWKGTKAIVVFADGSAEQFPLSASENFRIMVKKPGSDQKVDLFTREGGLPENAKVLNPE